MIKTGNLNAFIKKSEAAKAKLRLKAAAYIKRRVKMILKDALTVSPQWSGNYALNWTVSLKDETAPYDPTFKVDDYWKITPKQKGDKEAITMAMTREQVNIDRIKWNSKISIKNVAPVAEEIEAGRVRLRPVNTIPMGLGVVSYLNTKYKVLS